MRSNLLRLRQSEDEGDTRSRIALARTIAMEEAQWIAHQFGMTKEAMTVKGLTM